MYKEKDERGVEWMASDEMASEYEVQDLLYGIVRVMKPELVIETGFYMGGTTLRMWAALQSNKIGKIITCDTGATLYAKAQSQLSRKIGNNRLELYNCTGVEMIKKLSPGIVGVAFLDSGGDRLEEMKVAIPAMKQGGIIILHDAKRPREQEALKYAVRCPGIQLIEFDTPRGLAILQVGG